MSQENVEAARRWLAALSGESPDFDTALALVHDQIVFVPPGEQAPYMGVQSLRRWMEPDAFQEQVVTSFEPAVVGDRSLLARLEITARGAASGIELDVTSWVVFLFDDDGLIRRIEVFLDHEQDAAREAARRSRAQFPPPKSNASTPPRYRNVRFTFPTVATLTAPREASARGGRVGWSGRRELRARTGRRGIAGTEFPTSGSYRQPYRRRSSMASACWLPASSPRSRARSSSEHCWSQRRLSSESRSAGLGCGR